MQVRPWTVLAGASLLGVALGCSSSPPAPAKPAPAAGQKDDRDQPQVKEAKLDAALFLNGLLAGKYDHDPQFARVAGRVKGFQAWSIEVEKARPDNPGAADFSGTLTGPQGKAAFTVFMRKQESGKWLVGSFSGPNRE